MRPLVCWNCGENLADIPRPISRQANCPACFNELHCCRLCIYFDAQATTSCLEDRADTPLQKENANFCEYFSPQTGAFEHNTAAKSNAARGDLDALFSGEKITAEIVHDETEGSPEFATQEDLAKKKLDDLFS